MTKYTLISVQESQKQAIQAVFHSINANGLLPLSRIPKTVLTNPVTQCHTVDGDICVNFVNLRDANKDEAKLALTTAIQEEYCGVYGISLERQWPFQRFASSKLLRAEVSERLIHSVVFILAPPQKNRGMYKKNITAGIEKPTMIAFYEGIKKDGFAQSRDKSVVTGEKMPYSNRVTEIKTPHVFSKRDVYAVLVPEHLVNMARETFTELRIIPVAIKRLELHSLPHILTVYHDEKIKGPLTVAAPDYLSALETFYCEEDTQEFSLHAVRLHTSFDFTVRPVTNVTSNEQLLNLTHAKIAKKDDDDSAWIIVHKNFGLSKQNLFNRLGHSDFPNQHLNTMKKGCQYSIELFSQLASLKSEVTLNNVYDELSKPQLFLLSDLNVDILKLEHFFVIKYSPKIAARVAQIVNNFKSVKEEAATTIQAAFRGYRAKKFFQEYREKHDVLKKAQKECELARDKLMNLTERGYSTITK